MTIFKRPDSPYWQYDFRYQKKRYRGSTDQRLRESAARAEMAIKDQVRLEAWGLAKPDRTRTPTFTAWAERYLIEQRKRITRPDIVERTLRMVLAFWGAKPSQKPVAGGVYHNLRLADPLMEPEWIEKFETWMAARRLANSTKNSYRSTVSGMFALARRPRWQPLTRIDKNPFEHIERDRPRRRNVHLPMTSVYAWMSHAQPHAVLALAIGALAPKLRLQQVLSLRYDVHFDRELTKISFDEHKTRETTGDVQRTAVSADLWFLLESVRQARPGATYVVTYRGKPVKSIKRALRTAAGAAGLTWGMKADGVTFHALRHAMSSEIARIGGISRMLHASTMGHADPRTTEQHYTHLQTDDERRVLEQLAVRLGITDLAVERSVGTDVGTRPNTPAAHERSRQKARTVKAALKSPEVVEAAGRRRRTR